MLNLTSETSSVTGLDVMTSMMNKPIVYTLHSISGKCHVPIFTWKAEYNDIIAYGIGCTKKIAKRNAANNLFQAIKYVNHNIPAPNELSKKNRLDQYTKQLLNPINNLQELCVKRYYDMPKYKYSVHYTNSGKPNHEVICIIKSYIFKGNGKTKRIAKQQAALMMYNALI